MTFREMVGSSREDVKLVAAVLAALRNLIRGLGGAITSNSKCRNWIAWFLKRNYGVVGNSRISARSSRSLNHRAMLKRLLFSRDISGGLGCIRVLSRANDT